MIYLDAAATTPVKREVLEAMWPYLTGEFGNPSSTHELGHRAGAALKQARAEIAGVLGCGAGEITFTSGGTESDNLAIKGLALGTPKGRHIVTTTVEHEAVLESCDYLERHHGFEVTRVGADRFGAVDTKALGDALRADTTLVSVMLANNEVGTIEPLAEVVRLALAMGVPVHTDAVQGVGSLDLNVQRLGVDALTLSGHKVGTPKGIGLLYVRAGLALEAVLHGGGQERGRRSGTENVAGAVGLAKAIMLAESGREERAARLRGLRDELIAGVLMTVPGALLTGHPTERLANSASFCFPGTSGESVLLQLEERGILCSSGSACAAGRDEPSHVLLAMGIAPDVARTAVRLSLTDSVTDAEIGEVIRAAGEACGAVRGMVGR